MLLAIVFSINNCVSVCSKYTPFAIVFGHRPKFPLSNHLSDTNFSDFPVDYYIRQHAKRLAVIRQTVETNMLSAQSKLKNCVNANTHPHDISNGDYVYLLKPPTGIDKKF